MSVSAFKLPGRLAAKMPSVQGMTPQDDGTMQFNAAKTESGNVATDIMSEPQGERPFY